MPFGLTNAPDTYQRALDMILTAFKWKTCLLYIDDIIIYSNTVEEHIKQVGEVLSTHTNAGVTLKMKTCTFFNCKVKYLGQIMRRGKLQVHTASFKNAKPTTTKT